MKDDFDVLKPAGTAGRKGTFFSRFGLPLCLAGFALIVGAAYFTLRPGRDGGSQVTPAETPAATQPARSVTLTPIATAGPLVTAQPQAVLEESGEPSIYLLEPVVGAVTYQFSVDKLSYSETLDQWTTHKGMDIRAEDGAPVRASLDGVVLSVEQDSMMGNVVTLQHEGDLVTVYASLGDVLVSTGDAVLRGQTIGSVGNTSIAEAARGTHLHFEVLYMGAYKDPRNMMTAE